MSLNGSIDSTFVVDSTVVDSFLPIDSLWSRESLSTLLSSTPPVESPLKKSSNYIFPTVSLLISLLFFLFYREIKESVLTIFQSFFFFRRQLSFEDKISRANARNITTALSIPLLSLLLTLRFGHKFQLQHGIEQLTLLFYLMGGLIAIRLLREIILRLLGLLLRAPQLFKRVLNIGDNHFIIALVFTLPIIISLLFTFDPNEVITINCLSIIYIALLLLYFLRIRQIMRFYSFSQVFYILYLCTIEVVPATLLIIYILQYI